MTRLRFVSNPIEKVKAEQWFVQEVRIFRTSRIIAVREKDNTYTQYPNYRSIDVAHYRDILESGPPTRGMTVMSIQLMDKDKKYRFMTVDAEHLVGFWKGR